MSTGVRKGVQVTVCGVCCIHLNIHTLKILGNYFSYNKKLKEKIEREEKFLKHSNRYSTSFENMKNEKACTRKKNRYF